MTQSTRISFEDLLSRIRSEYVDALVSKDRRRAFDRLVEAWSAEMGAISYAESLSLMDLLLLTGEVDNRMVLNELLSQLDCLENRLKKRDRSSGH